MKFIIILTVLLSLRSYFQFKSGKIITQLNKLFISMNISNSVKYIFKCFIVFSLTFTSTSDDFKN